MHIEKIIKTYLKALEMDNYQKVIKLFSADATIHSPLYGKIKAEIFYKDLFNDTSKSTITLLNIFQSQNNPLVAAGHFHYDWTLKDGTPTSFECVDIFRFNEAGKIAELTIIYDSAKTRTAFEKLA